MPFSEASEKERGTSIKHNSASKEKVLFFGLLISRIIVSFVVVNVHQKIPKTQKDGVE